MKYKESNVDKSLRSWFLNARDSALLYSIQLTEGHIRGLTPFELTFEYPITAIAGKNGAGKSTMLALACCAYHNQPKSFRLLHRKQTYYTFADFFIQHAEDIPPDGIKIWYKIAHNNWAKSTRFPDGIGVGQQLRRKNRGGKWNEYKTRVNRNVVFLGIDRIVPHNEKSQSKSYSRAFSYFGDEGWEAQVKNIVGYILGKEYQEFKFVSYARYRLPIVKSKSGKYSGFNMGAGENALFELFSILYSIPDGGLVVIDEIELGLHVEAQRKLIFKLKEICRERRIQIICTTHSKHIFEQLPYDARVFLEQVNNKTIITKRISSEFAFSKLSSENNAELNILVEDEVAKTLLSVILPSSIRSRIGIEVIGSAGALSRQLAANYQRENKSRVAIVFDGDQRGKERENIDYSCKMSETKNKEEFKSWAENLISYLPGDTWPERWIVDCNKKFISHLTHMIGMPEGELHDVLDKSRNAGKHNEFHEFAKNTGLTSELSVYNMCSNIRHNAINEFDELIRKVNGWLAE